MVIGTEPRVGQTGRFGQRAAGLGAVVWALLPWLPTVARPGLLSLEHLFLLLPLVLAPLGYLLLSRLMHEEEGWSRPVFRIVAKVQPVAAALATAAILLPPGRFAGFLTVPWLGVAVVTAVCGLSRAPRGAGAHLSNVNLIAAHVFLVGGGVWLLMSRLGVGPHHLPPLRVMLAAVHFHFSGFALQILLGATGRRLPSSMRRMGTLHRFAAVGAVAGMPMIAAGHLLAIDPLRFVGVGVQVLVSIALAVTLATVALRGAPPKPRGLLLTAAASIALGMTIAGVYGASELAGSPWMGIQQMVRAHGLLNAFGFALCGMVGLLQAADG